MTAQIFNFLEDLTMKCPYCKSKLTLNSNDLGDTFIYHLSCEFCGFRSGSSYTRRRIIKQTAFIYNKIYAEDIPGLPQY